MIIIPIAVVAVLGTAPPYFYGAMISCAMIPLYPCVICMTGYFAGRHYKAIVGSKSIWHASICFTLGALLPVYMVLSFTHQNIHAYIVYVGETVTLTTDFEMELLQRLFLTLLSLSTSFVGCQFGYCLPAYKHAIPVNKIPRKVPKQPWYMNSIFW